MRDNIYVFLDFEFNCPEQKGSYRREIISMGAVFRYADGSPLTSFYSLVKPIKSLTISPRTTRLTGITQNQINRSKSFDKVSLQFLDLVDSFSPSKYFVWGDADGIEVKKSARYSHADKKIKDISDKFHDLQLDVMNELALPNRYNLERVADIYGIDFVHTFSAIDDANCLADIYFAYQRGLYDEERLDMHKKFYEYREVSGKYKLTKNNIKMANTKLEKIKKSISECEPNSEKYKKFSSEIDELINYITEQELITEKLEPLVEEAENFFEENKFG